MMTARIPTMRAAYKAETKRIARLRISVASSASFSNSKSSIRFCPSLSLGICRYHYHKAIPLSLVRLLTALNNFHSPR